MGGFCTKTCTDLVSLALFGPFYTSHSVTVLPVGVASLFGAPEIVRRKRVVRSFGCDVSARRKESKKRARFGAGGQLRQASNGLGNSNALGTRRVPCFADGTPTKLRSVPGACCNLFKLLMREPLASKLRMADCRAFGSNVRSAPGRAAAGAVWLLSNCQTTNSPRICTIEGRAMGRWRDSRGWRFCPKTFRRNDLHDLKILVAETLAGSRRPAFHGLR